MKTSWYVVMVLLSMLLVTWCVALSWWAFRDINSGFGLGSGLLWPLWIIYILGAHDD